MKFKSPRNALLFEERRAGATYRAIGVRHGITGVRVKQICDRMERMLAHPIRSGRSLEEFLREFDNQ